MECSKYVKSLVASVSLLVVALNANAGLLVNGSFEDHPITTSTTALVDSSSVPGWSSSTGKIEIWHQGAAGVTAIDGDTIIELNTTQNDLLYQEFDTVVGQLYELTFNYRARINDQERFKVDLHNIVSGSTPSFVATKELDDHVVGRWSQSTIRFVGQGSRTRLSFLALSGINSIGQSSDAGNLLDNVDVRAISAPVAVPEPGSIALLGLGLLGLARLRRSRS